MSLASLTSKAAELAVSPASGLATPPTVYLLPLTDAGAPDVPGTYIYLPPPKPDCPYSVRFQIQGTSSICRQGSLWVNIPAKGDKFQRTQYREYK